MEAVENGAEMEVDVKGQEDDWSIMRKIDRLFAKVDPCLVDSALSYLAKKYILRAQ